MPQIINRVEIFDDDEEAAEAAASEGASSGTDPSNANAVVFAELPPAPAIAVDGMTSDWML